MNKKVLSGSCTEGRVFVIRSDLVEDRPGDQRGVQGHDGNDPAGEETHHQVQPPGAHRQTAHLPGTGPLPRHRPLHPEEETVPVPLDQVF